MSTSSDVSLTHDNVPSHDVIVVGGGIAGLTAAYDLTRAGRRVQLIEAADRLGGLVYTERIDAYVIEAGADALLMQKPAAAELCAELDLPLVPTLAPRTAFVLRHGRFCALHTESTLGIPITARAIAESTMLSSEGQARLARELTEPSPNPSPDDDQSIGAFVRRRFGDEAVRYLAQPLLGGIHAGDVDRLSLRALFPALHDADVQPGSVLQTLQQRRREPAPDGVFRSIEGGLGRLIAALADRLPADAVRLADRARRITFTPTDTHPWTVDLDSGLRLRAPHIVLAVPAHVVADLVRPIDADLADLCGGIPYVSTASITLCYPRTSVAHPLTGTGFVVPRVEEMTRLLAVSWVTSKWAGRAPGDRIMIRAFAGGVFDADRIEWEDADLVRATHADLAPLLGLSSAPIFGKVYRWRRAGPQYEVGHDQRLRAIDARLAHQPGLFITGSGFRGVGVPDTVADARRVAATILGRA